MILVRIPSLFFVFDKLRITFKSVKKHICTRLDFVAKSLMTFSVILSQAEFSSEKGNFKKVNE